MKQDEKWEQFGKLLPVQPRAGLREWVMMEAEDYLGGEFLIYKRVSVPGCYPFECGGYEFVSVSGDEKSHWGAECRCTACQETFYGGWNDGKLALAMREDGYFYEGRPDDDDPDSFDFPPGSSLTCPRCEASVRAERQKYINQGRTYRVQVCTLERIGEYAVVMYWLVTRRLEPFGTWSESIEPRDAIVIDEKRKLRRFSHTFKYMGSEGNTENWEMRKTINDPEYSAFYSYNGGMPSRNTVGAFIWDDIPDLEGSTGEKSGIGEWFKKSRSGAVAYLNAEKQHPALENLVKAGWGEFLEEGYQRSSGIASALSLIDFGQSKPHRMLRMERNEFRMIPSAWDLDSLALWNRVRDSVRPVEFEQLLDRVGQKDAERIVSRGWPLRETVRYLEKQTGIEPEARTQFLIDYRNALNDIYVDPGQEADLFPPDLRAAHDAAMAMKQSAKDKTLDAKFRKLAEEYAPLEWTDGYLCIVLPRANADLIKEGSTLNHCVGRYGKEHTNGQPIFFVRHYRRPERSYYTLNEDLRGATPRRVQLHGYGNEFHRGKDGKRGGHHSIPPEVKAFCERWEKEVLAPWWAETHGNKKKIRKGAA